MYDDIQGKIIRYFGLSILGIAFSGLLLFSAFPLMVTLLSHHSSITSRWVNRCLKGPFTLKKFQVSWPNWEGPSVSADQIVIYAETLKKTPIFKLKKLNISINLWKSLLQGKLILSQLKIGTINVFFKSTVSTLPVVKNQIFFGINWWNIFHTKILLPKHIAIDRIELPILVGKQMNRFIKNIDVMQKQQSNTQKIYIQAARSKFGAALEFNFDHKLLDSLKFDARLIGDWRLKLKGIWHKNDWPIIHALVTAQNTHIFGLAQLNSIFIDQYVADIDLYLKPDQIRLWFKPRQLTLNHRACHFNYLRLQINRKHQEDILFAKIDRLDLLDLWTLAQSNVLIKNNDLVKRIMNHIYCGQLSNLKFFLHTTNLYKKSAYHFDQVAGQIDIMKWQMDRYQINQLHGKFLIQPQQGWIDVNGKKSNFRIVTVHDLFSFPLIHTFFHWQIHDHHWNGVLMQNNLDIKTKYWHAIHLKQVKLTMDESGITGHATKGMISENPIDNIKLLLNKRMSFVQLNLHAKTKLQCLKSFFEKSPWSFKNSFRSLNGKGPLMLNLQLHWPLKVTRGEDEFHARGTVFFQNDQMIYHKFQINQLIGKIKFDNLALNAWGMRAIIEGYPVRWDMDTQSSHKKPSFSFFIDGILGSDQSNQWPELYFAIQYAHLAHTSLFYIESPQIVGTIKIPTNHLPWKMNFQRVYLPKIDGLLNKIQKLWKEYLMGRQNIPPIHFSCNNFHYGNFQFDKIRFITEVLANETRIKKFIAQSPTNFLSLHGCWQTNDQLSSTKINGEWDFRDVEKTLELFGQPRILNAAHGSLKFNLNWPNDPLQPDISKIHGDLLIYLQNGNIYRSNSFMEPELELAKLLNLFNVQTLPNLFRFRKFNLRSKEIQFNHLNGHFSFENGFFRAKKLIFSGAIADIFSQGYVSSINRQYHFNLFIKPHFSVVLPMIAMLTGGPLFGVATWILNTALQPGISRAVGFHYHVNGFWQK